MSSSFSSASSRFLRARSAVASSTRSCSSRLKPRTRPSMASRPRASVPISSRRAVPGIGGGVEGARLDPLHRAGQRRERLDQHPVQDEGRRPGRSGWRRARWRPRRSGPGCAPAARPRRGSASSRMAATGWEKESFTGSSTRTTRSSPSPTTSDDGLGGEGVVELAEGGLGAVRAVLHPDHVVLARLADDELGGAHAAVLPEGGGQPVGGAGRVEVAGEVEVGADRPGHLDGAVADGRLHGARRGARRRARRRSPWRARGSP